jgi:Na+/phosphate symporter
MADQQRRRIEGAARLFAEALVESYRTATDRSVSAQELNAKLMEQFFNAIVDNLHGQAENMMSVSRDLAEQTQRGQEAAQTLMQESVGAYIEFMSSLFPVGKAERDTESGQKPPERQAEGESLR